MFQQTFKTLAQVTAMSALLAGSAMAYEDAIDLSSVQTPSSQYSLMLDVFNTGSRFVAVGERGNILISDDQGSTWQQAEVATQAKFNAVHFADELNGWAAGEDAVIVATTDGGATWTRQFDDRESFDLGPILDIYFKNKREGLAVGVYNKAYSTVDGGKTWQNFSDNIDNLDTWHLNAIADTGGQNIYISSEAGFIFKSEDGGQSYAPIEMYTPELLEEGMPHDGTIQGILARQAGEFDELVAFGVGGYLFVSKDSGASWARLETGVKVSLAGGSWLSDGSFIVVGTDGIVLKGNKELNALTDMSQDNGLPLSAGVEFKGGFLLAGFGGVQVVPAAQ